ncbi:MAG TPA: NADH-quinone oxidoreductase subunit A [Nonomuraea sp.]|nr:NADH-quinone oxidoreductase subunit A [Nonomuraea sp.]
MGQYLPVLVLAILATAFGVLSLLASKLLAPRNTHAAKRSAYESGIVPGEGTPERFPVRFYLIAMIFIVFDIEIIFLYPWAVHFDALGLFGLIAMVLFLVNVSIAYAYEWRRGGLEWD